MQAHKASFTHHRHLLVEVDRHTRRLQTLLEELDAAYAVITGAQGALTAVQRARSALSTSVSEAEATLARDQRVAAAVASETAADVLKISASRPVSSTGYARETLPPVPTHSRRRRDRGPESPFAHSPRGESGRQD